LIGGGWGLWLMGVVAGVWLLTSFVGLALAWPRVWLRMAGWILVLSARLKRGPYQANYQSYRAVGVWFQPVLILLAFTSFYQNLPQFVLPVVNAVSPLARRPAGTPLERGVTTISPDLAWPLAFHPPGQAVSAWIEVTAGTPSSFAFLVIYRRWVTTGPLWTCVPAT
jgi:uncharacterized iron-regulated membrane protein